MVVRTKTQQAGTKKKLEAQRPAAPKENKNRGRLHSAEGKQMQGKTGKKRGTPDTAGRVGPTKEKAAAAKPNGTPASISIVKLPIDLIDLNSWNPNLHSKQSEIALQAEIERLRCLPKPIVVRRMQSRFEVVDGEHALVAAKKLGFEEVPAQIIEADDYEARLQTLNRNKHGENDQLLLGRLYRRMRNLRQTDGEIMTMRALGRALGISEGTVRNTEQYAEAADLRNNYAPGSDRRIAALTIAKVRKYLELGPEVRDQWFDQGCQMSDVPNRPETIATAPTVETQPKNDSEAAPQKDMSLEGEDGKAKLAPNPDSEPGTDVVREIVDTAVPAIPEGSTVPPAPSTGAATDPVIGCNPASSLSDSEAAELQSLRDAFSKASELVQRKFMSDCLAKPWMLEFLRRVFKTGS